MALISWPSTAIMDALYIASCQFYLKRFRELSGQGNSKDLADPLWMAKMETGVMSYDDALSVQSLRNTMEDQMKTFYIWNRLRPYPKYDPDGTKYGSSTPVVLAKNADNKRLSISGLVNGYTITRGDFLSIPPRNCFLQVASASTSANSSGETGLIEVSPFIRSAVTAGDAIILIKPYVEVFIIPGQDDFIQSNTKSLSQLSFTVQQVL